MIKINRLSKPTQLTDTVQSNLTEEFKRDGKKAVWNKKYIKDQLLKMSHGKCCYCECKIGNGASEMHVDHFKPKKVYPELVVEWENLLPSCSYCNKKKSDHDTGEKPIIDPTNDNPKEYLYFKNYRYYSKSFAKDDKGMLTLDVLGLNDSEDKVTDRYKIGNQIQEALKDLYDEIVEQRDSLESDTRIRNRVHRKCAGILQQAAPTSQYSALIATVIHTDPYYPQIKLKLEDSEVWDSEMQKLHDDSDKIKLTE